MALKKLNGHEFKNPEHQKILELASALKHSTYKHEGIFLVALFDNQQIAIIGDMSLSPVQQMALISTLKKAVEKFSLPLIEATRDATIMMGAK